MNPPSQRPLAVLRFGVFEVDTESRELRKHGMHIRLPDQAFQILLVLLENAGRVVAREELHKRLWPADTFVEFDHNLNNSISRLREALSDSAESPRFIETLPRRGYRFIVSVAPAEPATVAVGEPHPLPAARSARSRNVLFAGAGLLLAVLLAVTAYRELSGGDSPINSVAVLPLVAMNVAEGSEDEYLAFGMTEALTAELSKIQALKVISQTSAMQYKGAQKSLPEIARELGVAAIVEGSVVRDGNEIRVTVQLIEAATDMHLWAETYQRELRDILTMQTEIARAIAREIHVTLTPDEQAILNSTRTVNPAAHEAYLRGRYFWRKQTDEDIQKALPYLEQAVAIDPSYAPAYAALSDVYWEFAAGIAPNSALRIEAQEKSRAAVRKALALDESLADAHVALGFLYLHFDWDWAGAEKEFRRALALSPNHAAAHGGLGEYFWAMNRADQALKHLRLQSELDPTALLSSRAMGTAFFFAGQYDQAIAAYQKAVEMEPDRTSLMGMGFVYAQKGLYGEAISAMERATGVAQSDSALGGLAYAHAAAGNRAEAQSLLRQIETRGRVPQMVLAVIYVASGRHDKAFACLEKGYRERESGLFQVSVWPQFEPLRPDPRYKELLRRMNVPQ